MTLEHGDEVRLRRRRRVGVLPLLGAVVALTAVVLAGCGDDSGDDPTTTTADSTTSTADSTTSTAAAPAGADLTEADLDGRTFLSTTLTGHDLVAGSIVRLTFDGAVLAVNAGCNSMTAEYALSDDGTLAWTGEPASTEMGCVEDLMAQDTWIAGLLTNGLPATLDGTTLTLESADVTIELHEETDAEVLGTTWTLETLIQDDAASSLPAGVETPTLEIADDGTATVFTGCNTGGTTVTVTDTTLTFEPMRLTRMACEGDASTVEAAVVAVLDGEVEAVVKGETLTLTKGTQGLAFRAS